MSKTEARDNSQHAKAPLTRQTEVTNNKVDTMKTLISSTARNLKSPHVFCQLLVKSQLAWQPCDCLLKSLCEGKLTE